MRASLSVVSGPLAGQSMEVSHGKLLIGREPDCHLRPDSALVSRHHCALLLDNYTLRIRDLASKNGTFVNSRRVGTSETILSHGDIVSVGDMVCRVSLTSVTTEVEPRLSEAKPMASPSSLEGTGIFEGDTVQGDGPDVVSPPECATCLEAISAERLADIVGRRQADRVRPRLRRQDEFGVDVGATLESGGIVAEPRKFLADAGHRSVSLGSVGRQVAAPSAVRYWPKSAGYGTTGAFGSTRCKTVVSACGVGPIEKAANRAPWGNVVSEIPGVRPSADGSLARSLLHSDRVNSSRPEISEFESRRRVQPVGF